MSLQEYDSECCNVVLEFAKPRGTSKYKGSHAILCRRPGEPSSDPVINARENAQRQADYEEQRQARLLNQLTDRTGMPLTQENGQRRYGPPMEPNLPVPVRGSEVFVGKIPRDSYEWELVPVFERAGRIYEMRLMMDFSGTNRGYCFVHYFTPYEADRAIRELNGFEIRPNRRIGVVKSIDNCRLYLGNIPLDKGPEDIRNEVDKLTDGVVRVVCPPATENNVRNRGFAFVEYENHRAAAMARRKFVPGKLKMWDIDIAVDWAEPEKPEIHTILLKNLSRYTTEDSIRRVLSEASRNDMEKVMIANDHAFVSFYSHHQAEIAKSELEDVKLDGSVLQVLWAKGKGDYKKCDKERDFQKQKGGKFRIEFDCKPRPIRPVVSGSHLPQNRPVNHANYYQPWAPFAANNYQGNFNEMMGSNINRWCWDQQGGFNRCAPPPYFFNSPENRYFSPNAHHRKSAFDFHTSGYSKCSPAPALSHGYKY